VLDIVLKIWAPLSKLFASSGVPIWLGPAYAYYNFDFNNNKTNRQLVSIRSW